MRTSANYIQILIVIIAFILGWIADIPKSAKEEKHIHTSKDSMVFQDNERKDSVSKYTQDLFDHPGFFGPNFSDQPSKSSASYKQATAEEATVKNYTFKVSQKEADKKVCIDIFRSGRKLRSDCADLISKLAIVTAPDPGTDINGDGVPDVIAYEDTGAWHCCSTYAIFSLGKKLKLIDVLSGQHSYIFFRDLDGDGKYEAIGRDWTFAYWNTSFAGSPAPEVVLRWKNGKYRLAEDLMKTPPPEKKILLEIAEQFKENTLLDSKDQGLHWNSEWWAVMLKLIYNGNGNLAWEFCEWFWPIPEEKTLRKTFLKEKKLFLVEFKKQLRQSPYWADLKKMNGW